MKIARLLMRQQQHDTTTFEMLIDNIAPPPFTPISTTTQTTYVFQDGSALIHTAPNEWHVVTNYKK